MRAAARFRWIARLEASSSASTGAYGYDADLRPTELADSRGAACKFSYDSIGELRPVKDANGNPTGDWIMDNNSSNTFARKDGTVSNADNLRASKQLMQEAGLDTSRIQLQNHDGTPIPE